MKALYGFDKLAESVLLRLVLSEPLMFSALFTWCVSTHGLLLDRRYHRLEPNQVHVYLVYAQVGRYAIPPFHQSYDTECNSIPTF